MLRKIVTLICIGLIAAAVAENSDKMDAIRKDLDKIMSKAGIAIDGEFKSEYFSSIIAGPGADSSIRKKETNEFSSVDFDINARPNEMVTGRLIFRMHQNWQNFFSDVSNPIFSRWISIDGNVKDMFKFNAGDFKQKYSPLTLYTPEINILYEPTIFARQREIAMDENFLGDNNRILQGVNLNFDAEIVPIFNEFHFGLFGVRLRSTEVNIKNGNFAATKLETAAMAKYSVGSNVDLTIFKCVQIGGTWMNIFDQKASYKGNVKNSDSISRLLAQSTQIISVRPGIDIAKIIGTDVFSLNVKSEVALSGDDTTWYVKNNNDTGFVDSTILGSAISLGAEIGYSAGSSWGANVNANYLMNSKNYQNELAQSPSFIGGRIMNIENGGLENYTIFDALYHNVFKFVPSDAAQYWVKAPFRKNSYYRSIFTKNDLNGIVAEEMDPALQIVMPYGPATPNRVGINADIKGYAVNKGINFTALISLLKEKDEIKLDSLSMPKANFTQIGGGIKLDFSKLISFFKYPLELSGSYVLSNKKRTIGSINNKLESGFLNEGLYYKFWKRTALLGGFQEVKVKAIIDTLETDNTFTNWALGIEWKVSEGADVVFSYGQIIAAIDEGNALESKNFHQDLLDLSVRVKF